MNAFCASVNFDAFIEHALPSQGIHARKLYLRTIQFPGSRPSPHWKIRPLKARRETKDYPLSRRSTGSQVSYDANSIRCQVEERGAVPKIP